MTIIIQWKRLMRKRLKQISIIHQKMNDDISVLYGYSRASGLLVWATIIVLDVALLAIAWNRISQYTSIWEKRNACNSYAYHIATHHQCTLWTKQSKVNAATPLFQSSLLLSWMRIITIIFVIVVTANWFAVVNWFSSFVCWIGKTNELYLTLGFVVTRFLWLVFFRWLLIHLLRRGRRKLYLASSWRPHMLVLYKSQKNDSRYCHLKEKFLR